MGYIKNASRYKSDMESTKQREIYISDVKLMILFLKSWILVWFVVVGLVFVTHVHDLNFVFLDSIFVLDVLFDLFP